MTSIVDQSGEIQQLKTLLFQKEAVRLGVLETDVATLQRYVGSAERLEAATAEVLVAALERAEVNRPRDLANAIAPTVVSAIRSEIQNSRDLMVDALYPITGRLVSAAVANAFKELVAYLEQRINTLTSTELWVGRVKSLATGRPISEFVLASSNPLRVDRLLFLERGNGRLVSDWKREEISNDGADLLSAMVAAILEFSVQALAGEGNLQKLDFGGREIALRASPRFILAAVCSGPLRPADDARLNALFFDTIESVNREGGCDAATLASLAASIETASPAPEKKNRRGKVVLSVLCAIAAGGLIWLAGTAITRTLLERRTNAALEQLAGQQPLLATFPLRLNFDHSDRSVSVSGIEPGQVDIAPLVAALTKAAAPYQVVNRIGVVPGLEQSAALQAELASTRQSLAQMRAGIDDAQRAIAEETKSRSQQYAGLRDEMHAALAGEARSRDQQYAGLSDEVRSALAGEATAREQQYAALRDDTHNALAAESKSRDQQFTGMSQQFAGLQSVVDSPAERLGRFMASTAIFFDRSDKFADDQATTQQIRQLAGLLAGNDLRVRIVGHADETGSESANKAMGRKRAERVMQGLISLGVEPSRLFVVSRSASMPISDSSGAASDENRRVTFENVFPGEMSQ